MKALEPNMYVRTKYGIFKIIKITKDLAYCKHDKRVIELDRNIPECNYRFSFYKDESIFKGAKFKDSIIDLIEVGDYVNGYPVYQTIEHPDNTRAIVIADDYKSVIWEESPQYIKSILTKEQFESMKYEVE